MESSLLRPSFSSFAVIKRQTVNVASYFLFELSHDGAQLSFCGQNFVESSFKSKLIEYVTNYWIIKYIKIYSVIMYSINNWFDIQMDTATIYQKCGNAVKIKTLMDCGNSFFFVNISESMKKILSRNMIDGSIKKRLNLDMDDTWLSIKNTKLNDMCFMNKNCKSFSVVKEIYDLWCVHYNSIHCHPMCIAR